MPTYNNVISGADAQALLMPEAVSQEIINGVLGQSVVMQLGRRLPNMGSRVTRIPVISSLADASFVACLDKKPTTEVNWDSVYLNAEKIAVIVPVDECVLEDAGYDVWGQILPAVKSAFGRVFDQAVLYGLNAPTSWGAGIVPGALATGNVTVRGTVGADIYDDIFSADYTAGNIGVLAHLEQDGYINTGMICNYPVRSLMRGLRSATGEPLYQMTMQESTKWLLAGEPLIWPTNGAVLNGAADPLLIAGDWSNLVWAVRTDFQVKILTEATLHDNSNIPTINLAQQDAVAMRIVWRVAYALPNPTNAINGNAATRFPFSVLVP